MAITSENTCTLFACAALLVLSGCATLNLDDPQARLEAGFPPLEVKETPESTAQQEHEKSTDPGDVEPGWHRIVYRGQVDWDGILERPIEGARVLVFDGEDELCSTVTDEKGRFELDCDLYGAPQEDWKGKATWRPESYYFIVAKAPTGGFAKQRLQEVDMSKALHLEITPP